MSRELGRAFGHGLENYRVGIAAAWRTADDSVADRRREAQVQLGRVQAQALEAEAALADLEDRMKQADRSYLSLVETRNQYPTEFSIPRGTFFVGVSILLLIGDMTILAGVLAQLLNLPLVDAATGQTVADTVSNPMLALKAFPHVIILTTSVLLLGFFPKIQLELPGDRTSTTLRWIVRILFVVSVAAVVLTAVARANIPLAASTSVNSQTSPLFYLASIFLGIALPYVSGLFFIRGTDKIGKRFDLWRLYVSTSLTSRRIQSWRTVANEKAASMTIAQAELARVSSQDFLASCRATAEAEFSQGYAEAAASLLQGSGPGTVYNALRTIAVRRAVR